MVADRSTSRSCESGAAGMAEPDLTATLRVLVLSADVGAGHDAAARALALEIALDRPDVEVSVENGLQAMGFGLRWLIRGGYARQLQTHPQTYELFHGLMRRSGLMRAFCRRMLALVGRRGIHRVIRRHDPDVVVSTYPAITMVLGHMRRVGNLRIPVCATITDLAGVELWTDPRVDFHLVMHERSLEAVERTAGRGSGRVVHPLVDPSFVSPREQGEARMLLGLPAGGSVVVVSGGGWGVGDLGAAAAAALTLRATSVLVVCGRNELLRDALRHRFSADRRVRVIGFTDQMSELLAAADVLVHTTGGVTSLEALVRGCHLVAYGDLPGHLRLASQAQEELGLAEWARTADRLPDAIRRALARPAPRAEWGTASASEMVLTARPRVRSLPAWRIVSARLALMLATFLIIGGWTLASDDPYPVVARAFRLPAVSAGAADQGAVGLVIRSPDAYVPQVVSDLQDHGAQASFALSDGTPSVVLSDVRLAGDEPLPELGDGGITHWIHTRRTLSGEAAALGVSVRATYIVPSDGFTLGQYLLARHAGALPVRGRLRIDSSTEFDEIHPASGEVVVVTIDPEASRPLAPLDQLLSTLARQGIVPVPLTDLLGGRASVSAL